MSLKEGWKRHWPLGVSQGLQGLGTSSCTWGGSHSSGRVHSWLKNSNFRRRKKCTDNKILDCDAVIGFFGMLRLSQHNKCKIYFLKN